MKTFIKIIVLCIFFLVENSIFCSSEKKLTPTQALLENIKAAAGIAYDYTAPVVVATGSFVQNNAIPAMQNYLTKRSIPTAASHVIHTHAKLPSGYDSSSDSDASSSTSSNSAIDTEYEFVQSSNKKTKKKIFFNSIEELNRGIQNNPGETMHRINNTIHGHFHDKNLESRTTQKQILHLITLLEQSQQHIPLQPVIADQYNPQQLAVLKKTVTDHATRILPRITAEYTTSIAQLEQDRDRKIATAHKKFVIKKEIADKKKEQKIGKSLQKISTMAKNSVYINMCASYTKEDHPLHDLTKFETQEKFIKALTDLRPVEPQEPLKLTAKKDKKKP